MISSAPCNENRVVPGSGDTLAKVANQIFAFTFLSRVPSSTTRCVRNISCQGIASDFNLLPFPMAHGIPVGGEFSALQAYIELATTISHASHLRVGSRSMCRRIHLHTTQIFWSTISKRLFASPPRTLRLVELRWPGCIRFRNRRQVRRNLQTDLTGCIAHGLPAN